MLKLGRNLFWPLWPWPLTLIFCTDITSVNGNHFWKFHDDTLTWTLRKRCNRRTDEQTDRTVARAAWSQLKYWKNVFGLSISFQPNLANLQPVTALISTERGTNGMDKLQYSLLTTNHKLQSLSGLQRILPCIIYINMRGCTLGWVSLVEFSPYLIR